MLFSYNRICKTNATLLLTLALLISLTSCGGTDSSSQTQITTAVQKQEEDTAVESVAAETAKEEMPPSPASYVFDDPDDLYINDGTVSGLYYFYRPEQGTLQEFAEFSDMTPPQAARVMTVGITDDGKALYTDSEKSIECDFAIDGENITLSSENEEIYGTLKDGLLTLNLKGIDIDPVFARPTEVAEYVSGTWTGQYVKGTNDNGTVWKEVSTFSLQLYPDGSGILHEERADKRVTWETQDGKIRLKNYLFSSIPMYYIGTVSDYSMSIFFNPKPDDPGMEYVLVRDGATSAKANTESTAAPGGDGIVSEEQLQKAYGWLHKVKRDLSHTTYEELVEFIGAEGELDDEETGRRSYQWVSEDDPSHMLYVNFKENTSGVYTVSGYNTSGFDRSDALSAYKEVYQEEIAAAEEAVANAATKDFSADIYPYGSDKNKVTVRAQIPEFGWGYDESTNRLVDNENVSDISYDAGIIQFQTKSDISGFDKFLNVYTNLQTIDDRMIGGVSFKGRTLEYDWTERTQYIAALDAEHAVCITIIGLDLSEGSVASRILDSMMFE